MDTKAKTEAANFAYNAGKMDALSGRIKDKTWAQTPNWAEYDRGFANYSM